MGDLLGPSSDLKHLSGRFINVANSIDYRACEGKRVCDWEHLNFANTRLRQYDFWPGREMPSTLGVSDAPDPVPCSHGKRKSQWLR